MSAPGDLPAGEFDLAAWLESLDLGRYAAVFAENEITREILPDLTDEDLRSCGVDALGHRKKLLKAIAALAAESTAAQQSPAAQEPGKAAPAPAAFDPNRKSKFVLPPPDFDSCSRPVSDAPRGAKAPRRSDRSRRSDVGDFSPAIPPAKRRDFWGKLLVSKFLVVSIAAHLLFGVGAAYYVVQQIHAKRKLTFQGGPPLVDPSTHALEHKISLAKKQSSGGAPPQARRIVTAGLASVSLPDLPSIPTATTVMPNMMAGLGGAGFGSGMGVGGGAGGGMGGGGGGLGLGIKGLPPALACRCAVHERLLKLTQNGGKPEVEPAVTRALDWLKTQQNPDGTWGTRFKSGMTGFALLCYLGRCATPDDPQYGEVVTKGLTALLEISKRGPDGLISTNGPTQQAIYEHGIATYALGEMVALGAVSKKEIPGLKEAFAAGVNFIISKQRPDGGWVYLTAAEEGKGSDLSVTGWQFQALKVAKLHDVKIEGLNASINRAVEFVKTRQNSKPRPDGGLLGGIGNVNKATSYNQWAMTGVGVLIMQTLGKGANSFNIENGLDFASREFSKNPPNWETNCDLYAWYYYSQAFFQAGGKEWRVWNTTAMAQVLDHQTPEGNWKPEGTSLHHAPGTSAGGDQDIFRTCLCTLTLEVYYRYLRVH